MEPRLRLSNEIAGDRLQTSRGEYANWRRVLEFVLDGLRAPGSGELPPVAVELPLRADARS
jgi:hypothetical protein